MSTSIWIRINDDSKNCFMSLTIDNELNLQFLRDRENIIRVRVRSSYINRKTYICFIENEPYSNTYEGIPRYVCDCADGSRTVIN